MTETTPTTETLLSPRNKKVVLVETIEHLKNAVAELSEGTGPFALDAERASGFKYSQRAYLVQVMRSGSAIFLIDPISINAKKPDGFQELAKLLSTDEWILHAATQDLPCLQELGLNPKSIFDTELAGRLLGKSRVGLGALTEEWLMLSLAKEHSAVDWSTRPLKAEWLNYAALDVDVLLDLRQAAYEELLSASKLDWAEQEFSSLLSFKPKPQKQDKWRSMSGLHEIKDQRSLAIARELWQARENLAMKMDVSPSRLVPDTSIVSVSKLQIKTRPALAGEKSFIGRASRTYLDTWWHAVSIGLETLQLPELKPKSEGIPSHRNWETRYPEAHLRLKTLRPKLLAVAEEQNLPIENLLQPDLLRQYCWQPPEPATEQTTSEFLEHLGARRWQIELVTPLLVKSLDELTNLAE